MKVKIKKLIVKSDERGWLIEILHQKEIAKKNNFGQIYLTVTKPGMIKGKHYHTRKTEYFCTIKGKGNLYLIDQKTKEKKVISMREKQFLVVEIPPFIWHAIKNIGTEDLYLLAYVDEIYNLQDRDTFWIDYTI